MMKTVRLGASACVAALALALTCGVASAQLQKAPEVKKVEPAAKAGETVKKVEPAAKPADATKKPDAKVVCAGTPDETACTAKGAECQWIAPNKTKAGKEIKAYCRTAPKKAAVPVKATTPAPAADKASAKTPATTTAPPAKAPAAGAPAAPKN